MNLFKLPVPVILLLAGLAGCSNKNYPEGNYQENPVKIDGDLAEWNKPLRFGSTEGQVQYNVTNDDNNIYVSIDTHDEATALKILKSGINVYFDASGGKSKKTCLAYPLPNIASTAGADRKDLRKALLIQEAETFNATGFKNLENRVYDISDKKNIRVALKYDENNSLEYEAAIPIKDIFDNPGTAHNLSVGIVINAMKYPVQNRKSSTTSAAPRTGMHGGGGGGRGMGNGGGGNYRRGNSSDMQTPERATIQKQDASWYKFRTVTR